MKIEKGLLQAKDAMSKEWLTTQTPVLISAHIRSLAAAVKTASNNVHAVGVGRKLVDGKPTGEAAVRFYVFEKLPESLLPARLKLPKRVEGFPTDVIESLPAFLLAAACSVDRKKRQRAVVAGISAGHVNITAGTISCFCHSTLKGEEKQRMVLSNNHVFADVNKAKRGDKLLQPGNADGGTAKDVFAVLRRFQKIELGGKAKNLVDAAVGEVNKGVTIDRSICSIGKVSGTVRATDGMAVRKHGRTTGYTEGTVVDVSVDALVGMDHSDSSVVARFVNQIRIDRADGYPAIGLGGDSGSLVLKKASREAVGLYFAGPTDGSYGLANHIREVMSCLGIRLP